jgi:4-amino-4-deoxy-L-arabinose transferase-like glycosyltransferase
VAVRQHHRPGLSAVRPSFADSRAALALIVGVVAVRLWAVGSIGLGDDEAYYWLWSRRLDLGYFDHPGGVAWLVAASTLLFGQTALAVRLPVVFAGGILAWMLGRAVAPADRTAAVLLGLFLPVLGLVGVFAAPDAPFLLAWLGAVLAAERLDSSPTRLRFLAVGAWVGLSLDFKLTGVLLGAGVVLWSLVDGRRRRWWTTSAPWLAVATTAFLSMPAWLWNLQHGLATLRFHALDRHSHSVSVWAGLGTWAGVHLVLLTPGVIGAVWAARRRPRMRSLLWLAMPCWTVFSLAALVVPTKLHWWAPAWLTVLPAAVSVLRERPRLWRITAALSVLLHGLVLGLARAPTPTLAPLTAELNGWEDLADRLVSDHPNARAWVTPRYQTSAQLAWGARHLQHPAILRVSGRADQFTIWGEDRPPLDSTVLLVCAPHLPCKPSDIPGLRCPDAPTKTPVPYAKGRAIREFSVWRCET